LPTGQRWKTRELKCGRSRRRPRVCRRRSLSSPRSQPRQSRRDRERNRQLRERSNRRRSKIFRATIGKNWISNGCEAKHNAERMKNARRNKWVSQCTRLPRRYPRRLSLPRRRSFLQPRPRLRGRLILLCPRRPSCRPKNPFGMPGNCLRPARRCRSNLRQTHLQSQLHLSG
jgi:hypothetical protein